MRMEDLPKDPHKPYEDIMAMLLGTLFVALGVTFYTHAVAHRALQDAPCSII